MSDQPRIGIGNAGRFLDPDQPAAKVFQAIQDTANTGESDNYVEGDLLINFLAIAEWMTPEGDKYLTRLDSELYPWERKGLLDEIAGLEDDEEEA